MVKHHSQITKNSVMEDVPAKDKFSLSKEDHATHVVQDRHPATVHNKNVIRFECWNVRTMCPCGKVENFKLEIERLKLGILGM